MKAIYINIDPYIAAFAAWLKGGKSGTAPKFDPIPLAVTIPLGDSVGIYLERKYEGEVDGADVFSADSLTIDGQSVGVYAALASETAPSISHDLVPGFSQVAPSAKYSVLAISGNASVTVTLVDADEFEYTIPFTVLVRREQASGPVDLVDFTPPASAIAAGTDLKGTKFDGNEIVAAETTGALSAPAGA